MDQVASDLKINLSLKKVVLAREARLIFDKEIKVENVLNSLLKDQHDSFVFAFESNGDCFIGSNSRTVSQKRKRTSFFGLSSWYPLREE